MPENAQRRYRRVFISYRRDDSGDFVDNLAARLLKRYGPETVFLDTDATNAGRHILSKIHEELTLCAIILVVVGPTWLTITDENGNRRLWNEDDYVHKEVKQALVEASNGARLFVVRTVRGKRLRAEDLPEPLQGLAGHEEVDVFRDDHGEHDFGLLTKKFAVSFEGLPRLRGQAYTARAVQAALFWMTAIAWLFALLRIGAPILTVDFPYFLMAWFPVALATGGLFWLWRPVEPRWLLRTTLKTTGVPMLSMILAALLIYNYFNPLSLTAFSSARTNYCGPGWFTQPFNPPPGSSQGSRICSAEVCTVAFANAFQEIRIKPGLYAKPAILELTAEHGFIDVIHAPNAHRLDVPTSTSVRKEDEKKPEEVVKSWPPAGSQQRLALSRSSPIPEEFVVWFRIGSQDDDASAVATLRTFFGIPVQEVRRAISFKNAGVDPGCGDQNGRGAAANPGR